MNDHETNDRMQARSRGGRDTLPDEPSANELSEDRSAAADAAREKAARILPWLRGTGAVRLIGGTEPRRRTG